MDMPLIRLSRHGLRAECISAYVHRYINDTREECSGPGDASLAPFVAPDVAHPWLVACCVQATGIVGEKAI